MENNTNVSCKSLSPTNGAHSDYSVMSPNSGECNCGSDSVLEYSCGSLFKMEIGATSNNHKPNISEDEEVVACKLKGVAESVNINVRYFNGSKFCVEAALESTVESFKELIIGNCHIPIQNQRLIHKGKILQNNQSLQSYGLGANHTVYLVRCFAPTNANDGTNNIDIDTTKNGDADGVRDGLLGEGFPDFEPMQRRHPLHGSIHPRLIREFLSTPDMQYLIMNPDIMWSILTNSQELSSIVFDPSSVSRILEDARIPGIVREIRRLADLELSSVESIPGGFNLLRYIYEDIVEENVTTVTGSTYISGTYGSQARDQSTSSETNAGSSLPNTTPLPNPWSYTGIEVDPSNIRRSTTDEDDDIQREPIVLERIDLSNVDSLLGGHVMPNADLSTQLVRDPPVPQEFIPANPEALCQFGGRNGEQNGKPDLSFLREEIQNPEFLCLSSQPETLQQPLSSQQDLLPRLNQQESMQEPCQTTGCTGSEAAEQLYATQLSQIQEMGFFDTQENIRALIATSGDVHAAIQRLSRNSNQ